MSQLLVVEDAMDIREIWVETLLKAGHEVDAAEDGVQAIKLLSSHHFDAILFDLRLPRLSGLEAIKLIRRTEPDLPILAITGMQDPDVARAALEVGANDVVFKPIGLDELVRRMSGMAQQPPREITQG